MLLSACPLKVLDKVDQANLGQDEKAELVQQMLQEGIIEPASGPWAAPVVIVNRSGHDPRFCVDFRGLNWLTVKDSYPLPRVDESLDFLSRGKFLTTLDLVVIGKSRLLRSLGRRLLLSRTAVYFSSKSSPLVCAMRQPPFRGL